MIKRCICCYRKKNGRAFKSTLFSWKLSKSTNNSTQKTKVVQTYYDWILNRSNCNDYHNNWDKIPIHMMSIYTSAAFTWFFYTDKYRMYDCSASIVYTLTWSCHHFNRKKKTELPFDIWRWSRSSPIWILVENFLFFPCICFSGQNKNTHIRIN